MPIDWNEVFKFSMSPWELMIRGSLVYWFLLLLFRSLLQRDLGAVGMADILVLMLIADAAQNAMAADYRSVSDGLVLISTILFWNLAVDFLAYRSPRLRRLREPRKLCLVWNGEIRYRNLRREFITEEDLRSKLREHGIAQLADVHAAYLEGDGTVSVIRRRSLGHDGATAVSSVSRRRRVWQATHTPQIRRTQRKKNGR